VEQETEIRLRLLCLFRWFSSRF